MTWKLNDVALGTGGVQVVVNPGYTIEQAARAQVANRLHALPGRRIFGFERARHSFRMEFQGSSPDRLNQANAVRDLLLDTDTVKLEAPAASEFYWDNGSKVIYLSADAVGEPLETGVGGVVLDIQATEALASEYPP